MTKIAHVISVPLEPPDAAAALQLRAVLGEMCAADPSLGLEIGPVNEIIIKGASELQLEIVVDRLRITVSGRRLPCVETRFPSPPASSMAGTGNASGEIHGQGRPAGSL